MMARQPKLALGTASFGMDYGVDKNGLRNYKVELHQVGKILSMAGLSGIKMIDTAAAYGTAIGSLRSFSDKIKNQKMQIVYKIPTHDEVTREIIKIWDDQIRADLRKLGQEKFYCVMVHNADDLLGRKGSLLFSYLSYIKQEGICDKIGVSVYYPFQMTGVLDKFAVDIVQLPNSIFDQRFDRTYLRRIKRRSGIEIHARSLFLQGKIFQDPEKLGKNFKGLKARLNDMKSLGITPLEACLDYLAGVPEIDYAIVGVHSPSQLSDIVLNYRNTEGRHDWTAFLIPNPREINPLMW